MPPDYDNPEKHRGFSFIEYESAEDAAAAIDNMVRLCRIVTSNLYLHLFCPVNH